MPTESTDTRGSKTNLVAFPITYAGTGVYAKKLEGTGYAVALDDDGDTGYMYLVTEDFTEALDSMQIYNCDTPEAPRPDEVMHIVWNPALLKAGLYYRDKYHAVVDIKNAHASCRSGNPPVAPGGWLKVATHQWDPKIESGMTFGKIEPGSD